MSCRWKKRAPSPNDLTVTDTIADLANVLISTYPDCSLLKSITRSRMHSNGNSAASGLQAYLEVTLVGQVSFSEATVFLTKVRDVATERGFDKVLVDCLSVSGELSSFERYELGRILAEPPTLIIAP